MVNFMNCQTIYLQVKCTAGISETKRYEVVLTEYLFMYGLAAVQCNVSVMKPIERTNKMQTCSRIYYSSVS